MAISKPLRISRQSSTSSGRFSEVRELVELAQKARVWWRNQTRWSVSVASNDRLYAAAHGWFTEGSHTDRPPRALSAHYVRNSDSNYLELGASSTDMPPAGTVELYYDERNERKVEIEGHKITVALVKPENSPGVRDTYAERYLAPDVLHFHAQSWEGQQAVIDMLRRLAGTRPQKRPALHLLTNWGDWTQRDDLPVRTLESVVLVKGQMERIQEDLSRFLAAEPEYVRRGLPWHRGYLLHGPPGTGKTSAVRALAASLGLDLWYAPLSDLQKDTSLLRLVNEVTPRSILLLEDVDIFHAARERDDDNAGMGVTMAGLLNALDGVATPHGLVVFMTTNDKAVIDPALLRPGRIDLVEFLDHPDAAQVRRLWANFYGEYVPHPFQTPISFKGSSAEAIEIFKQHPEDAATALEKLTLRHTSG